MSYATLSQIEQSVARIVVALGELQDWRTMPCSLQLLALGLLTAEIPDAGFSRLLERAEKYEEENPVLGFTAFSVYSHMYLAMSRAALAELDTRYIQSSVSLATTLELTEAA